MSIEKTVRLTPRAIDILGQVAEIQRVTLQDKIQSHFDWIEKLALEGDAEVEKYLQSKRKRRVERDADAYYKSGARHNITINRKGDIVTEVFWRMNPIITDPRLYDEKKNHVGEWFLRIQKVDRKGFCGFVFKTEYEFYPTLKRLKKAVNRQFKKYGYAPYYKERKKEGKL